MINNKNVGVISLGCDKNRVDTEKMLYILSKRHNIVSDVQTAQIIIVNTCGFLEASRKEAIEEIFYAVGLKQEGVEKVIVTGCLPQKFIGDIYNALPEVDAFLGVSDYDRILDVVDEIYLDKRVNAVGLPKGECGIGRMLTTNAYAYLKIADGCSNHCTYCLIPKIRGSFRSVPMSDLIEETKGLGDIAELILVAQDTARYGFDLGGLSLVSLIQELSKLSNVKKIRLLYCYPENITDELILEIKNNPKVIHYLDMPLQHADDRILKLMNRKGTGKGYIDLIEKLRKEIPDIAIRSTFITGFPTEDEIAFDNLVEFIKKAKLTNAGFFKYSKEEGTAAARLDGQVAQSIKHKRFRKLYAIQKQVAKENNKKFKGKTIEVLAEGFDSDMLVYYGRAYFNAPDIDGKVYFFVDEPIEYGKYYQIKIKKTSDYDVYGEKV